MRAVFEAIQFPTDSSVRLINPQSGRFASIWHFHPEIELKYVQHSRGLRFVGDSVEPFAAGELVLIGPNLPHVWLNDPSDPCRFGYARAHIAQFREDFLGSAFDRAPEFAPIADLLRRSRQGLLFHGSEARAAGEAMGEAWRSKGLRRLGHILNALDRLAHITNARPLSSACYAPKLNQSDAARINLICRYVQENLTQEISRPVVAALLRMDENAFSRFFRQKMGHTFSGYVNQLRIARAIHLMRDESKSVSEACYSSGFNNISNFNRRFRDIKGMTPTQFMTHLVGRATGER
jgi:AraC-like DNA-binding protein